MGLAAWYPIDLSSITVIREASLNRSGMVQTQFAGGTYATVQGSEIGALLVGQGNTVNCEFLDPDFAGAPNPSNATIAVWVFIPDTSRSGVFLKVGGSTSGWGIGIGNTQVNNTGNNIVGLYENVRFIPAGAAYGTGVHHVVMTIDASGFPEMFLDGRSVYSDATGAPSTPSAGLYIFNCHGNALTPVGCGLADARVWNRRLSAAEIQALYDPATRWDLYWTPSSRTFFDIGAAASADTQEWFPRVMVPRSVDIGHVAY